MDSVNYLSKRYELIRIRTLNDRSDRARVPGDVRGLAGGPHPGGGEADQQGEGGPGAQEVALPAQTAPSPV